MNLMDLSWHLLNFLAPSVVLASLTVLFGKLVWRRGLRSAPWRRLWFMAVAAAITVALAGLVLMGRDGKLATYSAMVLACALAVFVGGFLRRS